MRERHWHWAALPLLVAAAFADPLFTDRVFFYRDLGDFVQPVLAGARSSGGDAWPFVPWTHAVANGRPLLANPGYALWSPLAHLYRLPFEVGFNLFLVGHALIGAWGMAFLARRLGASPAGAFAAGAAHALGGGMISALNLYPTAVSMGWAPWALAAGHAATERATPARLALLASALALQALGGQPEPILATLALGAMISLATAAGPPLARLVRTLLAWGLAGAWALALASPQLVPGALAARGTLRAFGFTAEGILYNSLDPRALPGLVLPAWGGDPVARLAGGFPGSAWTDSGTPYVLSIHVGLLAAAAAALGAAALVRAGRARLAAALGVAIALGVVLALGRHLPGAAHAAEALAGWWPFRYPVKALSLAFLAVPPLAALGVDRAGELAGRRATLVATLLACAVALQLGLAHGGLTPTIARASLEEPPLSRELKVRAAALGAGDAQWRIHHERLPGSRWASAPGLEPDEQAQWSWRRRVLMPENGAAFGLRHAFEPTGDLLDEVSYFELAREAHRASREEWARSLGRAGVLFVVARSADLEERTAGTLEHLKALGAAELVPEGSAHLYLNRAWRARASMGASGRVTRLEETPSGVRVEVEARDAAELVLSDALGDLSAWRATEDGRPIDLRRAERAFVAMDVSAGRHVVEIAHGPPGLAPCAALSIAGWLAVLAALGAGLRRPAGRASGAPASSP